MVSKIYIDTSIFGGFFDDEFSDDTQALFKTKNNEKRFDCLKMKNHIQAQVYAETRDMSTTELLSYFNREYKGLSPYACRDNAPPPGAAVLRN